MRSVLCIGWTVELFDLVFYFGYYEALTEELRAFCVIPCCSSWLVGGFRAVKFLWFYLLVSLWMACSIGNNQEEISQLGMKKKIRFRVSFNSKKIISRRLLDFSEPRQFKVNTRIDWRAPGFFLCIKYFGSYIRTSLACRFDIFIEQQPHWKRNIRTRFSHVRYNWEMYAGNRFFWNVFLCRRRA